MLRDEHIGLPATSYTASISKNNLVLDDTVVEPEESLARITLGPPRTCINVLASSIFLIQFWPPANT